MKRTGCVIICLLVAVLSSAKTSFVYDVGFEMNFDNREFYKSAFSRSMTIFGARLTPEIGLEFVPGTDMSHRLMVGADMMKDFGTSLQKDIFRELTLYYTMEKDFGDTDMTLHAGIFPRRKMEGYYSEVFFSDSLKFYDSNLEGILLKFERPDAVFELGCDWMGKYGPECRERFMVFSSGEGKVAPILRIGYSAYMYHFASSEQVHGVVDNILLNPYARFDFGHLMDFDEFSVRLGWLMGMQNDRRAQTGYVFPGGGELDLEVRKWNFGVKNSMYYGTDMMPFYNNLDAGGFKYGNHLYMGDPFYRIHDESSKVGPGLYDRLDVYWTPLHNEYIDVKIGAMFHFHDFRYSGCQQVVKLCFNLYGLIGRKTDKI